MEGYDGVGERGVGGVGYGGVLPGQGGGDLGGGCGGAGCGAARPGGHDAEYYYSVERVVLSGLRAITIRRCDVANPTEVYLRSGSDASKEKVYLT